MRNDSDRPVRLERVVYEILMRNDSDRPVRLERVVYEILMRNDSDRPVRLERVRARHRGLLGELDGPAIERRMFSLTDGTPTRTLPAGGSAMLLLDLKPDKRVQPPARLEHRRPAGGSGWAASAVER